MITVRDGYFWLNGKRVDQLWGRSSFKLSNIITYHFTGQGGGDYSLGSALEWVRYNKALFGDTPCVLRVFLETAGWEPGGDRMFGSEPRDQGFWERERLRDGAREQDMHPVGRQVLEWFFKTSEEEQVPFELVIDATLKHDDIPAGEIDHVIRQVGVEMGRLAEKYPNALIIPETRNEWSAHNRSRHTLRDVNMWAVRWDRDNYWPGAPLIVDESEARFQYDVGPEAGKYRAGIIHPPRDAGWERWPSARDEEELRRDSRGMPWGANESMYYVEPEDATRAQRWYGRGGYTTDPQKYISFLEHVRGSDCRYFTIHDEKGAQCDPNWPRAETRVERWVKDTFGGGGSPPPPPPPPPSSKWAVKRNDSKELNVERAPELVQGGDEAFVLRDSYVMDIGDRDVWQIHVFHGRDIGDTVEQDTEIYVDGRCWYTRSDHDRPNHYDAYETVVLNRPARGELKINVLTRVVGRNEVLDRLAGRPHWGFRFVFWT